MMEDRNNPAKLSQRHRLGFLLKDSVLYGGAAALSKAFALITFPLLARQFTVAEYGILDYFISLAAVAAVALIFGQDSAVARYFYEHEEKEERAQIISQSLVLQFLGVAVVVPVLWIFSDALAGLFLDRPELGALLRIMLLQLPFIVVVTFCQNLLKWTFARTRFLILSLGFTAWQAAALFVGVAVLHLGVEGVLMLNALTSAIFAMAGLFFISSWLRWPRSVALWKLLVPFAAPYGVICILGVLSPTIERTLTLQLLGEVGLGLYAAATKVAMLTGLLVNAFQTAWGPFSLAIYKQDDAGVTYNWVFKHFAILICAVVFGLSLIAPPLISVLASDRFVAAAVAVFPLAMALAVQATSWITEIGISLSKRSHLSLYGYAALLSVTFGAIAFLAPRFGLAGVALAVLLGQVAKAIIASIAAQRAHPLPWRFDRVVALFTLSILVGLGGMAAFQTHGVWAYAAFMATGLIASVLFGWLIVLDRTDRNRLKPIILMKGGQDGLLSIFGR